MIVLKLFAQLAEKSRTRSREMAPAPTPGALLERETSLSFINPSSVRVSVNGRWAQWTTPLKDGDEVALLPPGNAL